jgi:ABC-2 type transport system ATP-binding protein
MIASSTGEAEILINGLKKSFKGFVAVESITFNVCKGEIFGLLGPNGAGKTTTINMICGLMPSTSGTIEFRKYDKKDPRTLIGYCPQDSILFPKLTCLEQLVFMGKLYGLSAEECRSRSLLLNEILGLSEKSGSYAGTLSGGMKRKLNLALALIHDPPVLVLDEPEAGLDPQSRVMVRNFIKSLAGEKTIILTSHNMDEVDRLADRVAIMDHGKILVTDTPENLKNSTGEGDILEIEISQDDLPGIDQLITDLKKEFHVIFNDRTLIIKSAHIIDRIHGITSMINSAGLEIREMKLRENTLEDVFIHLTGRMLRQ